MKKYLSQAIASALALITFLLPGCKKAIDYLKDNPTATFCPCQIKQFSYVGLYQNDTVLYSYNAVGDPISAIRAHPGTGSPNFFFRYDQHGRFTDLLGGYGSTPFERGTESWDRFFYDDQGKIMMDSAYFFPGVVDDHPTIDPRLLTSVSIIKYEYDSENRVSKASSFINGSPYFTATYAYDGNGNLLGHQYDNKINYHRTSKVWMFIDRDYSVNNPVTATYKYNNFGLPTRIIPFEGTAEYFLLSQYNFIRGDITYLCQGSL